MKKLSRHFFYQKIPDFISGKKKNIKIDQDLMRLRWFLKNFRLKNAKVLDIGSNFGFMCLNLSKIRRYNCTGYESEKPVYKFSEKLKKRSKLKNVFFYNKQLKFNNLDNLKNYDIIFLLNVLHHAGHTYDKSKIQNYKNWINYTIYYLKKIRKKSKYIFFQTGNVNFGTQYFNSKNTFKIIPQIMKKSGWKIKKIGVVENFKDKIFNYKTYTQSNIKKIPLITCGRNKKNNLVEYKLKNQIIFKHETGFLQRPLWICERK